MVGNSRLPDLYVFQQRKDVFKINTLYIKMCSDKNYEGYQGKVKAVAECEFAYSEEN